MAITGTNTITQSSDGVIVTEIKDGDTSYGRITTTIEQDTTTGSTRKLRMSTSFGFYGYDGTDTLATDKTAILALCDAIAQHFGSSGFGTDSVYDYVDDISTGA